MKFYIINYKSITQYGITNKGYYVSYKNKCEDNYSDSYIFAKRYKNLTHVLNRIGVSYKGYSSIKNLKVLEEGNSIIPDNVNIEIVTIKNIRTQKLDKIQGGNGEIIKNLGTISNDELIEFFEKEKDIFLKTKNGKEWLRNSNGEVTRTATQEEIDDFCNMEISFINTSFIQKNE